MESAAQLTCMRHHDPMDLDDWCDLDLAYLLTFNEHPDLPTSDA